MNKYPDLSKYNYEVIKELGHNKEGGRISYLGRNINTNQQVVIKQFRFFTLGASWEGFKIYEREIEFLKQLNHPRIPQYIDSFETDDGFAMVQEYKDAPSLANFTDLSAEKIRKIAVSVLEILVSLQSRKPPIIHRDLKPENILIDSEYNAYLIDFGLAKIPNQEVAISSMAMGTPGFMPPEEVFNRSLTKSSDLYSLGVTLICLFTRVSSTEIGTLIDDNYRFKFADKLSNINPIFLEWLKKMVEPNVNNRFADADSALNQLKRIEVYSSPVDNFIQISDVKNIVKSFLIIAMLALGNIIITQLFSLSPPVNSDRQSTLNQAEEWFKKVKPYCNSLEVMTTIKNFPPPKTIQGIGYEAACYVLAGKIEEADKLIQPLGKKEQEEAVNIVFEIGHPVADAGDDQSAGPIMNLVVKYQPWNYMALYHAGMSAYILGDSEVSKEHLESFLEIYQRDDGWRNNAIIVLNRIKKE